MDYYIGIDIGGTNIVVGIVAKNGEIKVQKSFKSNAPRSAELICDDIAVTVTELTASCGISLCDIKRVGAACPGTVKDGKVICASNLEFYNIDLKKLLTNRLNTPVYVCNDANAAAMAESKIGVGKNCSSLVMITIGTGIGGGVVINGNVVDGIGGAAAEIGHMIIAPNGRKCACGNRGCFEKYCSATALISDTKKAMIDNPQSLMWKIAGGIDTVDGRTAFRAFDRGDAAAAEVLDAFFGYFAVGISNIVTLLQPEIICIGGGMSAEREKLIDPILQKLKSYGLTNSLMTRTKVLTASLLNNAGVIGAALGEL